MGADEQVIIDALNHIPVESLDYNSWIRVGMALKNEGFDVSVWDEWSQADTRYATDDTRHHWESFQDMESGGLGGGTIIMMAKELGWSANAPDYKRTVADSHSKGVEGLNLTPDEEKIQYLKANFDSDDIVEYLSGRSSFEDSNGERCFNKCKRHTVKELIDGIENKDKRILGNPSRFGAVIVVNATNENGRDRDKGKTVKFRNCLVESDVISVGDQKQIYYDSNLPISTLTESGGKSLHAIIKVGAKDVAEFKTRTNFLKKYLNDFGKDWLKKHGKWDSIKEKLDNKPLFDNVCTDSKRYTRFAGFDRSENKAHQRLVAVNIGAKNWEEWESACNKSSEDEIYLVTDKISREPHPVNWAWDGMLSQGGIALYTASSKAGKSVFVLELACACALGTSLLGKNCKKQRVLIVNAENDKNLVDVRIKEISVAMHYSQSQVDEIIENVSINSMLKVSSGEFVSMERLFEAIINTVVRDEIDLVILDPIYNILDGKESDAETVSRFCKCAGRLSECRGDNVVTQIWTHHISQNGVYSEDRLNHGSGSTLFGRYATTIMDDVPLHPPAGVERVDSCPRNIWAHLREGGEKEFNVLFSYPVHIVDEENKLDGYLKPWETAKSASVSKEKRVKEREHHIADRVNIFKRENGCCPSISELSKVTDISDKIIRGVIQESERLVLKNHKVDVI